MLLNRKTAKGMTGYILTVNLLQILTSIVTLVIFGDEQMGAAGACQKCSIENVNKQTEKKNLFI